MVAAENNERFIVSDGTSFNLEPGVYVINYSGPNVPEIYQQITVTKEIKLSKEVRETKLWKILNE